MLFGDRLRKLRKNAGLSQAELGRLIGVSDRVVGYYETNVRFPKKPETLQKLSEVFNIMIDSLIGRDGDFIQNSIESFKDAEDKQNKVLKEVKELLAGGELSEERQDDFFRMIIEIYFEAKKENSKSKCNGKK